MALNGFTNAHRTFAFVNRCRRIGLLMYKRQALMSHSRGCHAAHARTAKTPMLALLCGLVLATSASAGVQVQLAQKLIASDAAPDDEFGFSVRTDGRYILAGALGANPLGSDSGAAYVFSVDPGTGQWLEQQKLIAPDGMAGDGFGQADISGEVIAVGARGADAAGADSGAAYLYMRQSDGSFAFIRKLLPSIAASGDGCTITDIRDDLVTVPCVGNDAVTLNGGGATLFRRDAGGPDQWGEVAVLTPQGLAPLDRFGGSAFDQQGLLAAARSADALGQDSGAVWSFARTPGQDEWLEQGQVLPGDGAAGDSFGTRAALLDDLLIVGARANDDLGEDSGAAYLFTRDETLPGGWREVKKLLPANGRAGDNFGRGLAILDAQTVVVSSPFHDPDDGVGGERSDAGAIYVFSRDQCADGAWAQSASFTPTDAGAGDWFGRQMSAGDGVLAVSAWRHDSEGLNAGAVYVLSLSERLDTDQDGVPDDRDNCTAVANTDQRDTDGDQVGNLCDGDLNNDNLVNFGDFQLFRDAFQSTAPDADFDGNGNVDFQDLAIFVSLVFQPPGPSGVLDCLQAPQTFTQHVP